MTWRELDLALTPIRNDVSDFKELAKEIRADMRSLRDLLDTINQTGSIGTKDELADHETRIRIAERWIWGIPATVLVAVANAVALVVLNH